MTSSVLGFDINTSERVELLKASRRQGTYFIAATGVGKSTSLRHLILEDIKQQIGVCVFDPHGDLIDDLIGSLHDKKDRDRVILLDATDQNRVFGINLYQCDKPTDNKIVEDTVERVRHLFELLWPDISTQPLVSQGIRNSSYAFIDSSPVYGCTMLELSMLFGMDRAFRTNIVSHLQDAAITQWWRRFESFDLAEKAQRSDMVVNKIEEYTTNRLLKPIIGQSKSTIDFREVIDSVPGKIVLVRMYGDNERMTQLIGAMVIAQLLGAALSRHDIEKEKRRQFHIYCDEFELYATDDFTRLLKECRKYGMGMTIAHQSREDISLRNKAASLQVANIIAGRLIVEDAKDIAPIFKADPKPGKTEYKPIPERQVNRIKRKVWEPPEAEAELKTAQEDLQRVSSYKYQLGKLVDIIRHYYFEEELLELDVPASDKRLVHGFYRGFNPFYSIATLSEVFPSEEEKRTIRSQSDPYEKFIHIVAEPETGIYPRTDIGWYDEGLLKNTSKEIITTPSIAQQLQRYDLHTYPSYLQKSIEDILRPFRQNEIFHFIPIEKENVERKASQRVQKKKDQLGFYRNILVLIFFLLLFCGIGWYLLSSFESGNLWSVVIIGGIAAVVFFQIIHGVIGIIVDVIHRIGFVDNYDKDPQYIEEMRQEKERIERVDKETYWQWTGASPGYYRIHTYPLLWEWYKEEYKRQKTLFAQVSELLEQRYAALERKVARLRLCEKEVEEVIDKVYTTPTGEQHTPYYRMAREFEMKVSYGESHSIGWSGGHKSETEGHSRSVSYEGIPLHHEESGDEEQIANAWNRTVDELVHLPVGVARCRVQNASGELEEHVIKLAMSTTGVAEKHKVEQWIEEIKEHMLDEGSLRAIKDVEQEITERHALLRQPPVQPILPGLPNQPARKKPINN